MNLFKKIWTKNFLKGKESLDKFSEDLGGLRGEFGWIKYSNGIEIDKFSYHNEITNLSKSTVIRLLAQGTSIWNGTIDPTQYRISKIRFGNAPIANHSSDLALSYYDLSEAVFRNNLTNSTSFSPAGGRFVDGSGNTPSGVINSDSKSNVSRNFPSANFTNWGSNAVVIINITSDNFSTTGNILNLIEKRPPSHKTLLVELLDGSNAVIGSLTFNSIYSRDTIGNSPTSIVPGINLLSTDSINHKLYYDYSSSNWKIQFRLGIGNVSSIINVRVSFKTGSYNIVNSIVPKFGYNSGSGAANERFPVSSGIDFYSVSNSTYNDSIGSSFVDDYSATFSITMAQSEGNGSSGLPIYYTEAFLFNNRDDLFSIVRFPYPSVSTPRGFEKDNTVSYLISWTIKSIL
jgi:hypothetical protein